MVIELIIIPEVLLNTSLKYRIEEINETLGGRGGEPINVRFTVKDIDFNSNKMYLLFCFDLYKLKEIRDHSPKMILMTASYPEIGEISREFNFAGIVSYVHFKQNFPVIFGLRVVCEELEQDKLGVELISSSIYTTVHKKGISILELIKEYLDVLEIVKISDTKLS